MKQTVREFCRRGAAASGLGPMVLAALYLVLERQTGIKMLTVSQVCCGIFSLTALAFLAGGMNVIYQVERLPLMVAVLIHGGVLYVSYLATYLINGWLEWGITPVFVFSGIFGVGYLGIWAVIYVTIRKKTRQVNALLKKQQKNHP